MTNFDEDIAMTFMSDNAQKELEEIIKKLAAEREAAEKEVVEKGYLPFKPPRPLGYHIVVKLHVPDKDVDYIRDANGNITRLEKSAELKEKEKWWSAVGQVVAIGPSAYRGQGEKYWYGPWCKIGDWVMFSRHTGTLFGYRGIDMYYIHDDKAVLQVDDPNYITRD